jgi:hypothetical protein
MKAWGWLLIFGVLLAGFWLSLELRANRAEAEWREFVATWEARGEAFDVEANLPPVIPDEENFAEHPWVKKVLEGDSAVIARLDEMDPRQIAGYEEWVSSGYGEDARPLMTEELAERVRRHGEEFATELREFEEALGRPGIRIAGKGFPAGLDEVGRLKHFANLGQLLDALSYLALRHGDEKEFTRLVVMELRAGATLRNSNYLMGVVAGAGFEGKAYEALGKLPELEKWPAAEKTEWLDALALRKRPLADEFVATLRVERGNFLSMLEYIERLPVKVRKFKDLKPVRREVSATAQLTACKELQEKVLANGSKLATAIQPERLEPFMAAMKSRKGGSPGEQMGYSMFFSVSGFLPALATMEEDRGEVREKLEKAMGKRSK